MEDREIVALYWQRDQGAIQHTQEKYHPYLMKIARGILGSEEDSQESVNDTYFKAWNAMPPHRPTVLATFLGKITRQVSIDLWRRRNSQKRQGSEYALCLDELAQCTTPDPQEEVDAQRLAHPIQTPVNTALPKFSTQQTISLETILPLMGMEAPFHGETADFSALGTCGEADLYINRVLHKSFIHVREQGTRAGAVTSVEMNAGSSVPSSPPKEVILDRPFVYLLVDCQENTPLFLGAMMDPTG